MNTEKSRSDSMLNDPIEQVIPRLAAPSIVSMLITAIYNMADTFFVSRISTSASGAVGIIFSAMAMIQAVSFMIGLGAGNNVSRILGSGHHEEAHRFVSTAWFTGFGAGCVIAAAGLTNLHAFVLLLGSTETIAPHAEAYARYILLAAPFMMCSFIMNNLLRFQGLAIYGMCGITTGGILNVILDPIFIFGLKMGTAGAGLATGLSQTVSFCILLFLCNTRKDAIPIRVKNFSPSLKRYGAILYTGAPSLARQGIASVSAIILNRIAGGYGDAAVAAMSIVSRFCLFINSVVVGFGQGFQPVCGFCFGAKRYDRVRQAFWFCVKVSTCILLVMMGICLLFSGHIIALFRKEDLEVIEIGTFALRVQLCTVPLWGYYTMSNMFSQSIGYGFRATIIACSRQGLILIPVLTVLPRLFGLRGLQAAQPLSDVIAFVLAFVLVSNILKELKEKERDSNKNQVV